MNLEKAFDRACIDGSNALRRQCGYNPSYFLQMVSEVGGVEATRRLLRSPNFQDGLHRLWEMGRLGDSVEAMALDSRWAPLFTDEEKAIARRRLNALGYVRG